MEPDTAPAASDDPIDGPPPDLLYVVLPTALHTEWLEILREQLADDLLTEAGKRSLVAVHTAIINAMRVAEVGDLAAIERLRGELRVAQERADGELRVAQERADGELRVAQERADGELRVAQERAVTAELRARRAEWLVNNGRKIRHDLRVATAEAAGHLAVFQQILDRADDIVGPAEKPEGADDLQPARSAHALATRYGTPGWQPR